MTDNKTIGISALITLGLIVAGMLGANYFEDPKYYCEDKEIILECPGGLSGGAWSLEIENSTNTYMSAAYYNNTLIGQLKPYISGTC